MNLKPFCLLFHSSLAVHQINTYSGNSAPLKFQCLLLFLSEQHPILLDRNGVHNRDVWKKRPMQQEQKASSYYVLLEYMKALNDYQCSWTRIRVDISWWLKALLPLFMTKKERCNFNGTWTSSVPSKRLCKRSLSSTLIQTDLWVELLHLYCSQLPFDKEPLANPCLDFPSSSVH